MASPALTAKAAAALLLVCLATFASTQAPTATSMGPQVIAQNKGALAAVGKGLGSQPIAFVAIIKLKPGTDVAKFVATREGVAARARMTYKDVNVAYIRGALPAKQETLPQGSAQLAYWPVAAIVTAPDATSYASYNAMVAKDPEYVSSGKNVEAVVRTVNLQM